MATTHFNEIKEYARVTEGFRNARMAFDEETLSPLYRLDMGKQAIVMRSLLPPSLAFPKGLSRERARSPIV